LLSVSKTIFKYCGISWNFVIFKFIGLFILGQSFTALGNFIADATGVQDDEFLSPEDASNAQEKRSEILTKKKKFFESCLFNESTDCPICLETFTNTDEVIELPCSSLHVYHDHCILPQNPFKMVLQI
jgi:hypothetical protein